MSTSPIDPVIAIPTFMGSLLSFLATSIAIVLHVVIPPKRHFRHALIINLLVAAWSDFMNSLNNTISGAVALASTSVDKNTSVGAGCIANAWFGQLSVQAIDFNILIISIVVLFTVLNSRLVAQSSAMATTAVCAAAWIPGIITSNRQPLNLLEA
ncbi:Git3 domain-containing protein [Fusarium falciforme]|uniref:Git3 domain-containing protein n=1 Tax=Fusarium falciforme TaxID=195108 RepID=UPI002300E023|nr:Git3 domain-containing protein [Fusarium falciforme]WAO82859.1 Git3 domain-containing protein [Fusarium falciforme]